MGFMDCRTSPGTLVRCGVHTQTNAITLGYLIPVDQVITPVRFSTAYWAGCVEPACDGNGKMVWSPGTDIGIA